MDEDNSKFQQQATMLRPLRKVYSQHVDRRATDARKPTKRGAIPSEMGAPRVVPRMKKWSQLIRHGVMAGNINCLERIAIEATHAEVLRHTCAVMILRSDVVDRER